MSSPRIVALLLLCALGCDDPGAALDAALDAEIQGPCAIDPDCDDGVYCNGREQCSPEAVGADERGCVAPPSTACATSQVCDEAAHRCVECTDADGDGSRAAECGGEDCDDADPNVFSGAVEICDPDDRDEDCDPSTIGERDADADGAIDAACCNADGSGARTCGDDCDDGDPQRAPGTVEECNGVDEDCDGRTDEGVSRSYFPDADGDGYGEMGASAIALCAAVEGTVENALDCDDADALRSPGAPEVCDGVDNDCNGVLDGPLEDVDRDGYANADCAGAGGADCADTDSSVHPGALEACNGKDDDCSLGRPGAGLDASEDADGDGFAPTGAACSGGPYPRTDCDDASNRRYPGRSEICDGLDNDCNGALDAPDEDDDDDGHADLCAGAGYTDCDDDDPISWIGAPERCDLVDNDCSNATPRTDRAALDEDADGDGHAPVGAACSTGYPRDDCDDSRPTVYAGAVETCDGLDDDCDGGTDEAADTNPWCAASATHAVVECRAASCAIVSCAAPFRDCDGDALTGCESDPRIDVANCSACGNRCGAGGVCMSSSCDTLVAIASARDATCVLRSSGTVACWPASAPPGYPPVVVGGLSNAVSIDLGAGGPGGARGCAIRSSGRVACWTSSSPLAADVGSITDALQVSVGATVDETCVRRAGGRVSCWSGTGAPMDVPGVTNAVDVDGGLTDGCVVRSSGALLCWGGRPGNGSATAVPFTAPVAPSGLSDGARVSVGPFARCALRASGAVSCWGMNTRGELGNGTTTASLVPTPVSGVSNARSISFTWGTPREASLPQGGTACAALASGGVACWGNNSSGQTGTASFPGRDLLPVSLGTADGAPALDAAVGREHACAITARGAACWGSNWSSQLGSNLGFGIHATNVPTAVVGLP